MSSYPFEGDGEKRESLEADTMRCANCGKQVRRQGGSATFTLKIHVGEVYQMMRRFDSQHCLEMFQAISLPKLVAALEGSQATTPEKRPVITEALHDFAPPINQSPVRKKYPQLSDNNQISEKTPISGSDSEQSPNQARIFTQKAYPPEPETVSPRLQLEEMRNHDEKSGIVIFTFAGREK